jgi:hypothetical protein
MTPCALTTSGMHIVRDCDRSRPRSQHGATRPCAPAHGLQRTQAHRADGALSGCDRWSARLAARSGTQVAHDRGLLSGGGGSTARALSGRRMADEAGHGTPGPWRLSGSGRLWVFAAGRAMHARWHGAVPTPRPSAGHSCRVPPIWPAHVGGRCDTVDKSWPPPSPRGHGGMPRIPG